MTSITDPRERLAALLGAIAFFLPYFLDRKTEFVMLYAKQNFVIFLVYACFSFLATFLGFIPLVGIIFSRVALLVGFLSFLFIVFLGYKAYRWERFSSAKLLEITNLIIAKLPFIEAIFATK